ncbi:TetR-like C-terminal domain-containing protein, partial [Bacillus thuringiensis]|nr:TetR-like C-terminal domain-containing protein [Bacillus thuringiensis]
MINRNTFYLHYVNRIDLVENLCRDSIDQLNVCINLEIKDISEMNVELFTSILTETFRVIESDIVFFKAMLSENGYPNFANHLKDSLKRLMLAGLEKYTFNHETEVTFGSLTLPGLVGVICMWIADEEKLQVSDIVDQLS